MSLIDREKIAEEQENLVQEAQKTKSRFSFLAKVKITFVSLVILFLAYSLISESIENKQKLTIDNPSLEEITVQLNNLEKHNISPETSVVIDVPAGEYEVKLNDEIVWKFTKQNHESDYILNPTKYIYLQEYILYWDQKYEDKIPNNIIEIDGETLEWPFKKYDWLYFNWDWNYDLDESYPASIKMKSSYQIKSKLYRFFEFVDMYQADYMYTEETTTPEENA